ncbi:MAG: ankyrin repeat domain-containing protein, partial [Victivallales bacterium]|nr:ankyrin repeat domain-containing protein [Victivallales bacterium]
GNYGDTPLFYAMEGGKLDAAMYLINHGADIKAIGDGRETLLHCAAMQDLGLVKYLVEHGLDVNAKNKAGVTPLHHAICRNRLDIAAYLLEHGADIQMAAANETPLPVCVSMFGTVETLKFLAEKGVDFKAKTKEGFTAMHAAVALNPAVVPYLRTLGLPELSEEEVKRAKKKYISNMMPEIIHCGHVWCHQDIRYRW